MTLPAFAAERRAAAPCYRCPAACDRTVSKLLFRCYHWTDRQTVGRTPYRYIDPDAQAYNADSVSDLRRSDSDTVVRVTTVLSHCTENAK